MPVTLTFVFVRLTIIRFLLFYLIILRILQTCMCTSKFTAGPNP